MAMYMKAQYSKSDGWWECGETGVLSAGARNGTYIAMREGDGKTFASECENIGESSSIDTGDQPGGQTGPATGTTGDEPDLGDGPVGG